MGRDQKRLVSRLCYLPGLVGDGRLFSYCSLRALLSLCDSVAGSVPDQSAGHCYRFLSGLVEQLVADLTQVVIDVAEH